MTDPIKAKIQELCPDVITRNVSVQIPAPFGGLINYRDDTITLAVVLRAIKKTKAKLVDFDDEQSTLEGTEDLKDTVCELLDLWKLEQDNYDQQSEEFKQLIGSLLGA